MSTLPLFLACLAMLIGADFCFSKEFTSDRFTRQSDSTQCTALFTSQLCSTGLIQMVADLYSQCRQYTDAYIAYVSCTRRENGDLCSTMDARTAISSALSRCQSSLPLSSSCSENCRQAVENLAEFGCCVNSIYNISTGIANVNPEDLQTTRYTQLFQNNLWARCGVDDLRICRSDVEIQVRETDQPCPVDTAEIEIHIAYNIYCNRDNLLPAVNALRSESDENSCYNSKLDQFRRSCAQTTNGTFCNSLQPNSQAEIKRQCRRSSLGNNDLSINCSCTSSCRDAIQSFRNEFECCVDTVNRSMYTTIATDGQLWDCCGVETVDTRCMDTLTSGSPAEGVQSTTVVALFIAYNLFLY